MVKNAAAFQLGLQSGFRAGIMPPDSVFEKVAQRTHLPAAVLRQIYIEKKAIAPLAALAIGSAALPIAGAAWDAGKNAFNSAGKDPWQQKALSNYNRNAKITQQAQMLRDSYNPQVSSPFGLQQQG